MKDFFLPYRLQRFSYFVRILTLNIVLYTFLFQIENGENPGVYWILFIGITIYTIFGAFLPRIRDCGFPVWSLILTFLPYISSVFALLLLFRPSDFTTLFEKGREIDLIEGDVDPEADG